jgi:hypothetical protein
MLIKFINQLLCLLCFPTSASSPPSASRGINKREQSKSAEGRRRDSADPPSVKIFSPRLAQVHTPPPSEPPSRNAPTSFCDLRKMLLLARGHVGAHQLAFLAIYSPRLFAYTFKDQWTSRKVEGHFLLLFRYSGWRAWPIRY